MKTIYTILFFLDLTVLIILAHLLLKLADAGGHGWLMIAVCIAMAGSIALLGTLLGKYVHPHNSNRPKL